MTKSSPFAVNQRITIGRIGAPHGIRGEMRVIPLTDFPDRFEGLKTAMAGDELLHISQVRYHKKFVLLRFEEYPTREAAMRLTGRTLTVSREEAVPLAEGEFYTFDIIGLSVENIHGEAMGTVENVLRTGSNDVYAVRSSDGKETLIPALKRVVKNIDLANGRMVVDLSEASESCESTL